MERKAVSGIMLALLLIGMLTLALNIQSAKASGTIYIRADGTVDPPTAPISSIDNVTYTFTDNIYNYDIVVERGNIVIYGDGYTLTWTNPGAVNGFTLSTINNVTIKKINIIGCGCEDYPQFGNGLHLVSTNNVKVQNVNIQNFIYGIRLEDSYYCVVSQNNFIHNGEWPEYGGGGIAVTLASSYNTISRNNMTGNFYGVEVGGSYNVFRNNSMSGNVYNFAVWENFVTQDVDDSNTVNGKRVYYLVTRQDMEVPSDAGYVALINSTNITVEGLELKNNGQGLLLAYTNNSKITNNIIEYNWRGIWLVHSSNNTISRNNMRNTASIQEMGLLHGVDFSGSSYNTVSENNITNYYYATYLVSSFNNKIYHNNFIDNYFSIYLSSSNYNCIFQNSIKNNRLGIELGESSNNKFFHNNFINNTVQVWIFTSGYPNIWDDGYPSGGNYWSDYSGTDLFSGSYQNMTGSDGIGDTPYTINELNNDRYPLMSPWTGYKSVHVPIKGGGNATITSNVTITKALVTKNTLHFDSSGPSGSTGWINVTFPMVNTTEIKVFINGDKLTPPPCPVINTNGTHYFIYFKFTLSTHIITIQFWLLGDITGPEGEPDCKVDITDLATAASAFGSYPDHPRWNPIADLTGSMYLVPDSEVDIRDIYLIARNFGKTYP